MKITRRRLLAAAIVLFAIAALAFDLGREPGFTASATLHPRAVGPYQAPLDPAYYRNLMDNSDLREYMRLTVGARSSAYLDAQFTQHPPDAILATVPAPSPARARLYADALARQIVDVSRLQLTAEAALEAKLLRQRLSQAGLDPARRRTLERRLDEVNAVRAIPTERVELLGVPPMPPVTRRADKLADSLPGAFPGRPSPRFVLLAALLLIALAWTAGVLMFRPDRIRSGKLGPL
jgi:hypothetical protein